MSRFVDVKCKYEQYCYYHCKGAGYCCIFHDISKPDANNLLGNPGLMIVGICKMHVKELYIKNQVFDYSWKKQ